jgi:hypothetical protein
MPSLAATVSPFRSRVLLAEDLGSTASKENGTTPGVSLSPSWPGRKRGITHVRIGNSLLITPILIVYTLLTNSIMIG